MMDWTDRHCRSIHRLISRHTWLYTEMVTADAVIHGPRERLLAQGAAALSDADALRAAGNTVDVREFDSLIHAFPNFFGLGGGAAAATYEIISALRAHLSRS